MEFLDLYDKYRKPLGKTIQRGEPLLKDEYRLTVHVSVFNSKGEMLIQQRADRKYKWPNLWDISVGGGVVAGETSQMGAQRELFEELGIDHDFSDARPHLTVNFKGGFDDHYLVNFDVDISDIKMQTEEVKAVKWASKEEIEKLIDEGKFIPYSKHIILALFELKDLNGAIKGEIDYTEK